MTKEMIVSSSAHETRVAILEDDQVAEIFIERERQRGVVGNLYKGRVSKVLPGMQSAFIDLGLERDGFLYVTDVISSSEEFDRLETDEDDPLVAVGRQWRVGDDSPPTGERLPASRRWTFRSLRAAAIANARRTLSRRSKNS